MPWAVAAAAVGAAGSIYASSSASDAQQKAAERSAALQQRQYEQTRGDFEPYRAAGGNALSRLNALYGFDGAEAQQKGFDEFREDPGYRYALDQGTQQVQSSAAARGMLQSGGTLKAIQDRGMNLADQGFSNYISRLRAAAESGQNAAAQTGTFGANAAAGQANAFTAAGNAQANNAITSANSFNNFLSQAAGAYGDSKGGAFGNRRSNAYDDNPWVNPF